MARTTPKGSKIPLPTAAVSPNSSMPPAATVLVNGVPEHEHNQRSNKKKQRRTSTPNNKPHLVSSRFKLENVREYYLNYLFMWIDKVFGMLNIDPNSVLKYIIIVYRYSILIFDIVAFFFKSAYEYLRLAYRFFVPRTKRCIRGETALVTGAGQGIGRAIAFKLAQEGCVVVCIDISKEKNDRTVSEIIKMGGSAHGYECDVSKHEQVSNVIGNIQQQIGSIDILINNAGVMVCRPFVQHEAEEIEKLITTNLLGQLWILKSVLPQMVENDKGNIVAMSSIAGQAGAPNMVPYTASKFGIRGMMEALYIELRQENPNHKVHLMTVSPFMVDTGMITNPRVRFPGLLDVSSPEEVADIVVSEMQRRAVIVFIPNTLYYLSCVIRMLPSRIQLYLTDFVDTGVGIDYTKPLAHTSDED